MYFHNFSFQFLCLIGKIFKKYIVTSKILLVSQLRVFKNTKSNRKYMKKTKKDKVIFNLHKILINLHYSKYMYA